MEFCYYCERRMLMPDPIRKSKLFRTADHVIPIKNGGKGNKNNIVYCCSECNMHKSGMSLFEFECFVARFRFSTRRKFEYFNDHAETIIKNIRRHPLYKPEFETDEQYLSKL